MDKKALEQKMFAIQSAGLKAKKDADNPFFNSKYTTLDGLWESLLPHLTEQGLLVYHHTLQVDGAQYLETVVQNIDEVSSVHTQFRLPDNLEPQKIGSAITYAKRYNLGQLFNIMTDADDDGNASSPVNTGKKKAPKEQVINVDDI